MYPQAEKIKSIVDEAHKIVIIQADNPDGDSLGSALALEYVLSDLGKDVTMYCAVDMPSYLHYLQGWDRVAKDMPAQFDASIIVDASTTSLLEKLEQSGQQAWVASKPCIVLDHHAKVENVIPYATCLLNDPGRSSAGELIFALAEQLSWHVSIAAQTSLMTAILGDTQGLTNQLTTAETYRIMGAMVTNGVDRPALEELRREAGKMLPEIFRYKGKLIERAELWHDNRIATVTIPQAEITQYSPLYNPAPLIQNDLLQTSGVQIAIVLKQYGDGKITAAIRSNPGYGIAAKLADHFGGGGHDFASGFKITGGRPFNEVKSECISTALALLIEQGNQNETVQYAYTTN